MEEKRPITVVLTQKTYLELSRKAKEENRPVAQLARLIIEKAVK